MSHDWQLKAGQMEESSSLVIIHIKYLNLFLAIRREIAFGEDFQLRIDQSAIINSFMVRSIRKLETFLHHQPEADKKVSVA